MVYRPQKPIYHTLLYHLEHYYSFANSTHSCPSISAASSVTMSFAAKTGIATETVINATSGGLLAKTDTISRELMSIMVNSATEIILLNFFIEFHYYT